MVRLPARRDPASRPAQPAVGQQVGGQDGALIPTAWCARGRGRGESASVRSRSAGSRTLALDNPVGPFLGLEWGAMRTAVEQGQHDDERARRARGRQHTAEGGFGQEQCARGEGGRYRVRPVWAPNGATARRKGVGRRCNSVSVIAKRCNVVARRFTPITTRVPGGFCYPPKLPLGAVSATRAPRRRPCT
eukprot:scaffold2195_cov119-Phaeocystis_antarctica.AAC.1